MKKAKEPIGNEPVANKLNEPADFEAALAELEKVVAELDGDVKLERALELFKRGMKLSTSCKQVLQTTQQEIMVLKAAADGSVTTEPLEEEAFGRGAESSG